MSSIPLKNALDIEYYFKENPLITYQAADDGTPFEPQYTELNGKYSELLILHTQFLL